MLDMFLKQEIYLAAIFIPRVIRVIPLSANSESDIIRIAAAIDTYSNHPLAQTVVEYANQRGVNFPRAAGLSSGGLLFCWPDAD